MKLVYAIILGAPIVAIGTGYFTEYLNYTAVTPGVVFTGGIVVPLTFLFSIKNKSNTIFLLYVGIIISLTSILYNLSAGNQVAIPSYLSRLFKIIFPFLGFGFLKYVHDKKVFIRNSFLWRLGYYYGLVTAISIIVFAVLGIGVDAVRGISFTSSGLYGGGNDTGLVLLISYCLFSYYNYKYQQRRLLIFLVISIFYLGAGVLLGTRTTLLGLPTILLIVTVTKYFSKEEKPSRFEKTGLLILIVGFITAGVYLVQFLYANDMFKTIARVQEMTSGGYEIRGRLPAGIEKIKNFNLIEHLFGAGEANFSLVENDIVDIYGKFGFPFLLIVYGSSLYFLFNAFKAFLYQNSFATLSLCMGLSLYILHGSLAGHAFASAQVNNLIMVVYFLIYRYSIQYNKFTKRIF